MILALILALYMFKKCSIHVVKLSNQVGSSLYLYVYTCCWTTYRLQLRTYSFYVRIKKHTPYLLLTCSLHAPYFVLNMLLITRSMYK
jgi:hypothetical protein